MNRFVTVLRSTIINYNLHKMIIVGWECKRLSNYFMIFHKCREIVKHVVKHKCFALVFFVWFVVLYIPSVWDICIFNGRDGQSIQNAQIGFSALNAINTLHEMYTSCNNTYNICRKIVIIIYHFVYIFIIFIPWYNFVNIF